MTLVFCVDNNDKKIEAKIHASQSWLVEYECKGQVENYDICWEKVRYSLYHMPSLSKDADRVVGVEHGNNGVLTSTGSLS